MSASVPSSLGPHALLAPVAPAEAYTADVDRLGGQAPISPADDAWLALAQTFYRAASLPPAQRARVLTDGAHTATALIAADVPVPLRGAIEGAARGIERLSRRFAAGTLGPCADVAEVVESLQQVIGHQEEAGAFLLAHSTLSAVRQALGPILDGRSEGYLIAQQGRAARQIGATSAAAELYQQAAAIGVQAFAPDVVARALLGRGVLANMRGNYPEARELFTRARDEADRAGDPELRRLSYHGMLRTALAAHDVDTALAHGWIALQGLAAGREQERAELLVNLGEVSRIAGEHRAALRASLAAAGLSNLARMRLPALGTAALAAATLGETRLLQSIAREVDQMVVRSGQPFENAHALAEVAEAFGSIGDARAVGYAERAAELARVGDFYEITLRMDRLNAVELADGGAGEQPAPSLGDRSEQARAVLNALEALPNSDVFAVAAR